MGGHTEMVKLLIEAKTPVLQANNDGWNPLLYAAKHGHVLSHGPISSHFTTEGPGRQQRVIQDRNHQQQLESAVG